MTQRSIHYLQKVICEKQGSQQVKNESFYAVVNKLDDWNWLITEKLRKPKTAPNEKLRETATMSITKLKNGSHQLHLKTMRLEGEFDARALADQLWLDALECLVAVQTEQSKQKDEKGKEQ